MWPIVVALLLLPGASTENERSRQRQVVWDEAFGLAPIPVGEYDPLRDSEFVVRGRVVRVETKEILMSEWEMADVGMEESTMMVTYVRVAVSSVLRGKFAEKEVVFGANGGISPCFVVKDEYLLCAKWRPVGESGVYVIGPYLGMYHRTGNTWTRVCTDSAGRETEALTDEQLRSRMHAVK